MSNPNGESVEKALRDSVKRMGYCMSVYSNDDGAFATKSQVQDFFNSEGINHIITKTHPNAAKRFIKTMNQQNSRWS